MSPKYIAVYGTLKKGRSNHHYMRNCEFVQHFKTEPIYTMITNGNFPIVKRGGNTSITCEIYKVTDEANLKAIYGLEGYSGVQGSVKNWYDTDTIKIDNNLTASIFVMDADKYNHLRVIESGIF